MPKLSSKEITLKQLQTLSPQEQEKVLAPIIEASQKHLTEVTKALGAFRNINFETIAGLKTLADQFRAPELPDLKDVYITPKMAFVGKSDFQLEQEAKQAYLLELHIKALEKELSIVKGVQTPQYDINSGVITFLGKEIELPLNTNLEMVARVVLKNLENMKRKWSWDEVVEENREDSGNFDQRKIYTAARAINEKVAQETTIKDFLITKPTSTIQLNPIFLPK